MGGGASPSKEEYEAEKRASRSMGVMIEELDLLKFGKVLFWLLWMYRAKGEVCYESKISVCYIARECIGKKERLCVPLHSSLMHVDRYCIYTPKCVNGN